MNTPDPLQKPDQTHIIESHHLILKLVVKRLGVEEADELVQHLPHHTAQQQCSLPIGGQREYLATLTGHDIDLGLDGRERPIPQMDPPHVGYSVLQYIVVRRDAS